MALGPADWRSSGFFPRGPCGLVIRFSGRLLVVGQVFTKGSAFGVVSPSPLASKFSPASSENHGFAAVANAGARLRVQSRPVCRLGWHRTAPRFFGDVGPRGGGGINCSPVLFGWLWLARGSARLKILPSGPGCFSTFVVQFSMRSVAAQGDQTTGIHPSTFALLLEALQ